MSGFSPQDFDVDVILDASVIFKSESLCRNYLSKLPLVGVNTPVGDEVNYWSSITPLVEEDVLLYFWTPTMYVRESVKV